MNRYLSWFIGLLCYLGGWSDAAAIPLNTRLFCEEYPLSPLCRQAATSCQTCHSQAPALHSYGQALQTELQSYPDYDRSADAFRKYLKEALRAVENLDSDQDEVNNRQEIDAGTSPADPSSKPDPGAGENSYDWRLAWQRVHLLFCGQSPEFAATKAFASLDTALAKASLHQALDGCLNSAFWREQALPRLADDKIRPSKAVGIEGDPFVIGDFYYDYRLFTHVMTDDRDMRDLPLANYHIAADGSRREGPIPDSRIPGKIVVGNGQPLGVDRRYGMITTQWFISANTMFAELPRNTASQAYRAYLGYDIAKSEGLYPVALEPRDVDHKGVKADACAFCHSTLDPLAYAFSPYMGLSSFGSRLPVGAYNPNRRQWEADSWIFGEPVQDLGDWVEKAIQSDAFAKNLTRMLMTYALGRAPQSTQEQRDFNQLWPELSRLGFSANRLLHAIIAKPSFGAPTERIWKRSLVLEADLARALSLSKEELCRELGQYSCLSSVHQYALGGNDPFAKTQYTAMEKSSQLSAVAVERVISQACLQRIQKDAAGSHEPIVFRQLPLDRTIAESEVAAIDAQWAELYRRFLIREPKPDEQQAVRRLVDRQRFGAMSSRDLAHAMCLAVAPKLNFSTIEELFYAL